MHMHAHLWLGFHYISTDPDGIHLHMENLDVVVTLDPFKDE